MKSLIWCVAFSSLFVGTLAKTTQAQAVENFSQYSRTGAKVGTLTVHQAGGIVDVYYSVSDNGRGPKTFEHIVIGKNGLPSSWTITGHSYAGGAVRENMEVVSGHAVWDSLAEKGSSADAEDKPYIAANGSPWSLALYARLAANKPQGKLEVLPSGTLRAQKRQSLAVGENGRQIKVDLYALDGLELSPNFILLDSSGRLFAQLGEGLLLRDGYEAERPRLTKLYEEQKQAMLAELHAKLAHRITVPWRVTNVRIFDAATKSLGPISTVSIFDNRIVRVEPGMIEHAPAGEKLLDGGGGTLMPGLVDMHAHESDRLGYARLAAGVTTIRDMGNDNARLLEMDYQRRVHAEDGPRIVRAGFLEGRSPFSSTNGILAENLEEARSALHWYADHNYAYLKIYNSVKPEWVKPLAAEAHSLDMKVLGHLPAFATADQMIEAGYDEITHLNQLMLQYVLLPGEDTRTPLRLTAMHRFAGLDLGSPPVRRTIELMKTHHVGLDTTIAAMERLNIQRDGVTPEGDALYLDHMPVMFQRNRRSVFLDIPDEKTDREHFAARDKLIEMVSLLHKEGIPLWPGTDDAVAYTLHRELALYVKAGIPAAEVLQIDTYDTHNHLGLGSELGTISRGKLADFILIPGDPTKDIETLRNVNLVVKDGIVYFPTEIYEALNIRPFSTVPELR